MMRAARFYLRSTIHHEYVTSALCRDEPCVRPTRLTLVVAMVILLLQPVLIPSAGAAESKKNSPESLAPTKLTVENVTLNVSFAPGALDLSQSAVLDWVATSARAVARYYGQFPVPYLRLLLTPEEGAGVRFGTTIGGQNPLIKIWLGQSTESEMLPRDWVMPHEMIHLAFPRVAREHHW